MFPSGPEQSQYHDLLEARPTSFPLHRPYDCAIDLIPGTTPPRCRLYSLSGPETKAMEEYVEESLATGGIRPSASPASAWFFFVEKKYKTLRPCIDYRGLNDIKIKNPYPLPLLCLRTSPGSHQFFPNWTFGMPTTWFGYANEMSGRQPLIQPVDIMSTRSCHLDSPMPPLFFRLW